MKEVTLNSYSAFTIPFAGIHEKTGLIVRSDGYVLSTKNRSSCVWKKGSLNKAGYYTVCVNKKRVYVHRLVAETFLRNNQNLPVVDHIDRDRQNSSVFNLRFCSYSENICNSDRVDNARTKPKKLHREYCKESHSKYCRQYYLAHKEDIKDRRRKYYQENKDSIAVRQKEYHKKYYSNNREKILLYGKEYYNRHKAILSESAPIPCIEQTKSDGDHED